ncbi:MAG: PKD domain-containing protein [Bacteroidota bacterium]
MDKKLHINNTDDFLKDALKNYEAPYHPADWAEMEKLLDIKGKSVWYKRSSLSKLIGGGLIILIAAFCAFHYISKVPSETDNEQSQNTHDEVHPYKDAKQISNKKSSDMQEGQSEIEQDEKMPGIDKKPTRFIPDDNLSDLDKKYLLNNDKPSDANEKSYFIKEETSETQRPWLDMLRNAYIEQDQQIPVPSAVFTSDKISGCKPLLVQFKSDHSDVPKNYLWDFGNGFYSNDPNPEHLYEQNGIYDVTLTVTSLINEKIESKTINNMITVYSLPMAKFDWHRKEPIAVNRTVNFINQSKSAVTWQWDFGDNVTSTEQNPNHVYNSEGVNTVELIVKNAYGCYDTSHSFISVISKIKEDDFYTPNAFSPNGDGINDVFCPIAAGISDSEFEMTIYDRNGNLVYETTNINQPWTGRIKNDGKIAPEGIYIWLVIIENKYGEKYKHVGHVTLIR